MCTVSMVGDHFTDKWTMPQPGIGVWPSTQPPLNVTIHNPVTREEFDALKRDVEEMKALLKRAKEYDERNGEAECELEERMAVLRKVAKMVGVSLDDVIGPETTR